MNNKQHYLASRILLTLSYTEQFKFPLLAKEVYERLISKEIVSLENFNKAIKTLVNNKLIFKANDYLFIVGLSNNEMISLTNLRKKRSEISKNKRNEVNQFLSIAKHIPFITGIAVTGSLAVNNATKDDDIDFMVVTSKNRLWLTRIIMIVFASSIGKRRSFAKEEKNSWCFNLWVEESDLQLPVNSRSIYESYEVVQSNWVLSRNNVASRFRSLNSWTNKFLVNSTYDFSNLEKHNIITRIPLFSEILDLLNYLVYLLQFIYMKKHMTREKVSFTHAFFHPRDTKSLVFNNWRKTLLRLI